MDKAWILVANASRARICIRRRPGGKLHEVAAFVHPASRQAGSRLDDDRAGQAHRSLGESSPGGTAYEPRTDARHKERERFARELARHLDQAFDEHRLESLRLVASNPFLGELSAQLSERVARIVASTEGHDLSGLSLEELARRLPEPSESAG